MIKIYGISNCDTIKKTRRWFSENDIDYQFVDFKKSPPNLEFTKYLIEQHGWETIINKRGTTWRKLDKTIQTSMDAEQAMSLAVAQPSIIKRPIIENNNETWVGFDLAILENIIPRREK